MDIQFLLKLTLVDYLKPERFKKCSNLCLVAKGQVWLEHLCTWHLHLIDIIELQATTQLLADKAVVN